MRSAPSTSQKIAGAVFTLAGFVVRIAVTKPFLSCAERRISLQSERAKCVRRSCYLNRFCSVAGD